MKNSYSTQVSLLCPTCGFNEFSYDDALPEEDRVFLCISCGIEFSQQNLLDENQEILSRAAEEIGNQAIGDLVKDLRKSI